MRSRYSLATLVLGVAVLGAPLVTVAESDQPYIVVFHESAVAPVKQGGPAKVDRQRVGERVSEAARRGGFQATNVFGSAVAGFSARLTPKQVRELRSDPAVAMVVPDEKVTLSGPKSQDGQVTANVVTVTDAKVPAGVKRVGANQNPLAKIDKIDNARVDVDVAVLDTGIDRTHPDLNIAGGYNCTGSNRDNWNDVNGHGTHVAGSIAAIDNEFGVVGVAPGARLWAVKIMGNDGSGLMSWIICGIDWVTAQRDGSRPRIEVANMSIRVTGNGDSRDCGVPTGDSMHKAICRAVAGGTVFVAAAGNDKKDAKFARPAAYNETITVSAMADYDGKPGGLGSRPSGCGAGGADDAWASFSNFGNKISLIAPGVCVLSTYAGGQYAFANGTSMAAPHVAGAAALYLAQYPDAKPQQVRMALQHVATYQWKTKTDPDGKPDRLLWATDFAPPPDFGATADPIGPSGYARLGTNGLPVKLVRNNGHTAPVTATVNGLPAGVTAAAATTTGGSATVALTVGTSASSGRYPVSVRTTDGELTRNSNYELAIDADPPTASFSAPAGGRTLQATTTVRVDWTESDKGGSGVAGRTMLRQRGLPSAPGDCSATKWADSGSRTSFGAYNSTVDHGYCYRWVLDLRDKAGNRSTIVSGTVLVDTTAPSRPSVSVSGATSSLSVPGNLTVPEAWSDGSGTVWFRGGGSGRVDLRLEASDEQSGVASYGLTADSATTGWTIPSGVDAASDGSAVARLSYGTKAGTLNLSVRPTNGAGTKGSAGSVTLRPDATAPASSSWVSPQGGLTVTGTSVVLSWTGGSDSGSGLADAYWVRRFRAPATSGGGCGSFSANGDPVLLANNSVVENLKAGYCYRWRLRTTDRVGNMGPVVESGRIRVTTSGPSVTPPALSGPTVTDVAAVPGHGTRLTAAGAVRVTASWASTSGGSALAGHEIRVSRDGGTTWGSATSAGAGATSLVLQLASGTRYVVGVRARDAGGAWSDWATSPVFDLRLVQGEGSGVTFSGTWKVKGVDKASAKALRLSKAGGSTARLSFTGRSVALVSMTAATRGKADIYVDGKLEATIDLYGAVADHRRLVFSRQWATSGSHTIEVRVKGTSGRPRVDVDAFVVLN